MTRRKSPNVYKSCPKMILLQKWKILTPLQNLPKNVGDLGKLIVAKGFKKLPKVQKIDKYGHTGHLDHSIPFLFRQILTITFTEYNVKSKLSHPTHMSRERRHLSACRVNRLSYGLMWQALRGEYPMTKYMNQAKPRPKNGIKCLDFPLYSK